MSAWNLPPGTPIHTNVADLLERALDLPPHVAVYLPNLQEAHVFSVDSKVILFDGGEYGEHLSLDGQGVVATEPHFEGYGLPVPAETIRDVVEVARFQLPDDPAFLIASLNHFYLTNDTYLTPEQYQGEAKPFDANPERFAFVWNGEQPGWVVLRIPGGTQLLYHQPTRQPLRLPDAAWLAHYSALIDRALVHGIREVEVQ